MLCVRRAEAWPTVGVCARLSPVFPVAQKNKVQTWRGTVVARKMAPQLLLNVNNNIFTTVMGVLNGLTFNLLLPET